MTPVPPMHYDPDTFLAPHEQAHLEQLEALTRHGRRLQRARRLGALCGDVVGYTILALTYGPLGWFWRVAPVSSFVMLLVTFAMALDGASAHAIASAWLKVHATLAVLVTMAWGVYQVAPERDSTHHDW